MLVVRLTVDKALEKAGISRYALSMRTGIRYQVIDNCYKNKVVRYDSYVLGKICDALECDVTDLIEYVREK